LQIRESFSHQCNIIGIMKVWVMTLHTGKTGALLEARECRTKRLNI
jgi:hypothetical protein